MPERKRGGQPGNANAMKHGRYSVPKRAERRAISLARHQEEQRQHATWMATMPATDYSAITDRLRALKDGRLAMRGPVH